MALLGCYFSDYAADGYVLACILITISGAALFGFREFKGRGLKYSKFAQDRKDLLGELPSKLAFFFFYAPSALAAAAFLAAFGGGSSFRLFTVAALIFLHFFKRVMEVLFLHRYSGNAELVSSIVITALYTFATINLLYAQKISESLAPPQPDLLWIGVATFLVGITGNFYHHYLLAQLRSGKNISSSKKMYVVPQGGLFEQVTCPHYLFEIITFAGIAMASQTALAFATFLMVATYLTSRSLATREWYVKKVDGFPISRKALLPFIL